MTDLNLDRLREEAEDASHVDIGVETDRVLAIIDRIRELEGLRDHYKDYAAMYQETASFYLEQRDAALGVLESFANLENWFPDYDMADGAVVHAWDGHYLTDEPWTLAQEALAEHTKEDNDAPA